MPAGLTEAGAPYSPIVGLVYVFNLIVGTGALTMPSAFHTAGWAISIAVVAMLGFMSYLTAMFVIESMASANAVLRLSQQDKSNPGRSSMTGSVCDEAGEDESNEDMACSEETSPLLVPSQSDYVPTHLMDISERMEMGQMVSMFFNKVGVNLFYVAMVLYLYGDLAIYAVAVPKSLRDVACTYDNSNGSYDNSTLADSDPCWPNVSYVNRGSAYRIFLAIFTVLLTPFVFFDVQKMKVLQITTTVVRWLGFVTMVALACRLLARGEGGGRPATVVPLGVPRLFGVCVYAFMCHHSLPSLVTPVRPKHRLSAYLAADYVLIAAFYLLLSVTAVFAFRRPHDLYTLDFRSPGVAPPALGAALALFPVFALGTNFPIIAITLRNNLGTLFGRDGRTAVGRYALPLLALVPPVGVAMATDDVSALVGVTGSYAGAAIQYVVPAFLVWSARGRVNALLTSPPLMSPLLTSATPTSAPLTSPLLTSPPDSAALDTRTLLADRLAAAWQTQRPPFRHTAWIVGVLAWATLCVGLVTVDHIITRQ